jgi:hypothetical protein
MISFLFDRQIYQILCKYHPQVIAITLAIHPVAWITCSILIGVTVGWLT